MSPRLALQFLGIPQLNLDDIPVTTDRRKAIAILAYLAVNDVGHSPQRYSRESLSALFWPDYEQSKAFSNLRRTIWEIHQVIGEGWLIAERESLHLNENKEIDLDVSRFQNLLIQSSQQSDPAHRTPLLVESAKLYRNHFLTGFGIKDAFPFNEWAFAESEELRHKLAEALTTLSEDYCALGQAEKAIPYARRLITLDPLNESAHRQLMEVYLQAGQHSAALKQYQTCEQILRKELDLDPQPETRALYKKIRKRDIKSVRTDEKAEAMEPKHNLPLQLSSFIGREKETEDVANLLARNRLVTLAGVGGIGKTRLSLRVGQRLLNEYPDGVWFIPLDSLADPALVPQTVASVFEIRGGSDRPVIEILMHVLREKTTLLILDNCEHLLDSCAQLITTLLTNCPNLKILATSREILSMKGEATYYLPSLSLPEDNNLFAEKLTEYESVQLFVERAALALSSFRLMKKNAKGVTDICYELGGIPLAIELAAARVNVLTVDEILKQLHNSFSLLASDGRTNLPRHQTLQASMDWSWGLLTESEQIFMRRLSVFGGGWTLESSQSMYESNILNLISALVRKSLMILDQESGRETRYRFHEIVRQYMREKLIESGEEENIRTRHLQYFLQFCEQAEAELKGHTQMEWYARLFDERDNIRAALEWADETDVEAGLYISGRLHRFWESFELREGARWLVNFLEKPASKDYPHARAKALYTQTWMRFWAEEFNLARVAAQECLDLYRACDDKVGELDGLLAIGLSEPTPWTAEALELHQQALGLSKSLGDEWRQAQVLIQSCYFDNDYHHRIAYIKEALALFQKVGDLELSIEQMLWLGNYEMVNGKLSSAQKWMDQAVEKSQELNHKGLAGLILHLYGIMALIRGDYEKARIDLQKAIAIIEDLGNRLELLWARVRLGYIALRQGEIIEARRVFTESALDFQKSQSESGVIFTLEGMADLYVKLDKLNTAARLIGWTDATREKNHDARPLLEQADVDQITTACIIQMGEAAFSDAYDEGQKMTLDTAVAYALQEN